MTRVESLSVVASCAIRQLCIARTHVRRLERREIARTAPRENVSGFESERRSTWHVVHRRRYDETVEHVAHDGGVRTEAVAAPNRMHVADGASHHVRCVVWRRVRGFEERLGDAAAHESVRGEVDLAL